MPLKYQTKRYFLALLWKCLAIISLSKIFWNSTYDDRSSENRKHKKITRMRRRLKKWFSLHRPTAQKRALSILFCYSPFTKGVEKIHLFVRRLAWKVQTNGENDYYLKSLSLPASFLVRLTALDKNYFHLFTLQSRYIRRGDFYWKAEEQKNIIWPPRWMVQLTFPKSYKTRFGQTWKTEVILLFH